MNTRIEAAAKAINDSYGFRWMFLPWDQLVKSKDKANQNRVELDRGYATSALAAADAHDAAQGIHRVRLDPNVIFGAIYGATDQPEWAVGEVVDAVISALKE